MTLNGVEYDWCKKWNIIAIDELGRNGNRGIDIEAQHTNAQSQHNTVVFKYTFVIC